jgi:hypothetical protein
MSSSTSGARAPITARKAASSARQRTSSVLLAGNHASQLQLAQFIIQNASGLSVALFLRVDIDARHHQHLRHVRRFLGLTRFARRSHGDVPAGKSTRLAASPGRGWLVNSWPAPDLGSRLLRLRMHCHKQAMAVKAYTVLVMAQLL